MKSFKEYYWLAPAIGAAATHLSRVNPSTYAQAPSMIHKKAKDILKGISNKYKKRKVSGVKTNEMMTAGDAGIPQDTKNMGPRKKGKRFTSQNFVDGRKRKDNPFPLLRRFNTWNNSNG